MSLAPDQRTRAIESPSHEILALAEQLGYELLGPIFADYLDSLESSLEFLAHERDCTPLYMLRAGIRIRELQELRGTRHLTNPWSYLSASRMMVCKGIFLRRPELSLRTISAEFQSSSLREAVRAILASASEGAAAEDELKPLAHRSASELPLFLKGKDELAVRAGAHLQHQGELFEEYIGAVAPPGSMRALLDSGWQGTAQRLLTEAFPDREFVGLYFGRSYLPGANRSHASATHGVAFEADSYDPAMPLSGIVLHRHLIESLLEPNAPSLECLAQSEDGVYAPGLETLRQSPADSGTIGSVGVGLRRYLVDGVHAGSRLKCTEAAVAASKRLAAVLTKPSFEEAIALAGKDRSADFGRVHVRVPVLRTPVTRWVSDSSEQRIRDSLWPQGQAAVEFDEPVRSSIQSSQIQPFLLDAEARSRKVRFSTKDAAAVAVITRTKNRPVLLKRAAQSLISQSFKNWHWIVVNDGGAVDAVIDVVHASGVNPAQVTIVHHPESMGMEAASNAGIQQSSCPLIVIHDDDDSWQSEFLASSVAFLSSKKGLKYGGSIAGTIYIEETIEGDIVTETFRRPYNDWVERVQLAELVAENYFAPIAFVFRREVYDRLGGYDEALPVLGDWDFNVRFLLESDIGVIRLPLANYHHRRASGMNPYSNSVIGGISLHSEYASIVRNKWIRTNPQFSAAICQGYFIQDTRGRLESIKTSVSESRESTEKLAKTAGSIGLVQREHPALADALWCFTHVASLVAVGGWAVSKSEATETSALYDLSMLWNEPDLWLDRVCTPTDLPISIATSPTFDEVTYLTANPDVAEARNRGGIESGYHHYLLYGRREGRSRPTKSTFPRS